MVCEGGRKLLWSKNRIGHNHQIGGKAPQQERAPKGQNGAPGDCGSFVGVSSALSCFGVDLQRTVPRARLLKIKYLKITKRSENVQISGNG
jgi:hypothetical protein